jgi:hypothetical protein
MQAAAAHLDLCTVRYLTLPVSLSFLTDSSLSLFSAPLTPHLPPTAALPPSLPLWLLCCALGQRPVRIWIFSHRMLNSTPQQPLHSAPLLTLSLQQLSTHHSPGLSCSVCSKATVQVSVFPACGCLPRRISLWQKLRLELSPPQAKLQYCSSS